MATKISNRRQIEAFELYFRKNGQKQSLLCNTPREVGQRRRQLARNHRKFLGVRPITLVEIQ